MGVSRSVYIGWYLKVWLPKETADSGKNECGSCKETFSQPAKFCPNCGNKLVKKLGEKPIHPYDYIDRVFGDEDCEMYFTYDHPGGMMVTNKSGFVVYLPNHKDMKCGFWLDEYDFEQELAWGTVTHKAWDTLIDSLGADGIKHELKCGVINSYG